MSAVSVLSFVIALVLELILCPIAIPLLHKLKFGQYIREDGPQAHLKKTGTPTMGGIMIVLSFLAGTLLTFQIDERIAAVLFLSFGFAAVGFLDDYLKVVKKKNEGLKAWQKWLLQCVITGAFLLWIGLSGHPTSIPLLVSRTRVELGVFYYVFAFLFIMGFVNGTNFTDGLDGLASGVTLVVAAFFALFAFTAGDKMMEIPGMAMMGALTGFLFFNIHPAKVFMGDTGSLALGGFVSAMALLSGHPLVLFVVGFIYVAEVASVILQVGYFKLTHGKRIFRMAPIHHHFELGGWEETKVVGIFVLVTVILCVIAQLL